MVDVALTCPHQTARHLLSEIGGIHVIKALGVPGKRVECVNDGHGFEDRVHAMAAAKKAKIHASEVASTRGLENA